VRRLFVRRGLFEEDDAQAMLAWPHSGFHVHDAVLVPDGDVAFALRLARYCAGNPVALGAPGALPLRQGGRADGGDRYGRSAAGPRPGDGAHSEQASGAHALLRATTPIACVGGGAGVGETAGAADAPPIVAGLVPPPLREA